MEGSMITVVEPSKCQTRIRKNHGQKPKRSEEHADLLLLPGQEKMRSYKIARALIKRNSIKALDGQRARRSTTTARSGEAIV